MNAISVKEMCQTKTPQNTRAKMEAECKEGIGMTD